ncbi:MAG: TetR/AcrR family transcriptional regulator [Bacteroidetes bacterium SB0662_bin_6]|nr:TetR/AcrR family transcriptional regulator [Bacteroidetes bacterium SB0668_bin_1]MYE04929.1 TetR/AcrR family transcriptional regulator [Bacteroidetes bacterium SB0662_bin_6]
MKRSQMDNMIVDAQGEQLRADILNAAATLFGEYGYRAVGVDAIAGEAEVAKRTLYRYFTSKDELVLEYLGIEAAHILTWLEKSTENARTPLEKLKAFFFALAERTGSPHCRGCPFQMALGEYPDKDHAINRLARRHKEAIRTELEKWCTAAGFRDIVGTAHRLYLLMEGAWAYARLHGASPVQVPVEHRVAALNHAVILLLSGGLYAETLIATARPGARYRSYRPEDAEEEPVEPETLSLFGSAPPLSGADFSPPSTTKSD